ncbi:putative transposase, Tnp1/En/Spm [Rosa chinensis]|uniref:Putative transposase, Tnp1/En/Spm n=1 Tax=Rosa chinensis TaxID=74649 RepID=A0A2P6P7N7_ROSCH|nr:putative transposase, Tnp1/En/Spm [Rosa chinensis]
MKVLVDISNKPDAFLWRPTSNMFCFQYAQGKTRAWPADRVIFQMDQQSDEQDNLSMPSSLYSNSRNKCKLFDWTGKDETIAEGSWHSSDPKALVNGIPLGPNGMIVWVDIPKNHEAFLWRPTIDMKCIEDAVNSAIVWPANKVVLEKISES